MKLELKPIELKILTNFCKINTNFLFKKDYPHFTTISTMRNVFAKFDIDRTFEKEFGIYDMHEFLSCCDYCSGGTIDVVDSTYKRITYDEKTDTTAYTDIKDHKIIFQKEKKMIEMYSSDPSVIVAPTKPVNMPEADVTMHFTKDIFESIHKPMQILKTPDVLITEKGGEIIVKVLDKKNRSNNFSYLTGQKTNRSGFRVYLKPENLIMLHSDYKVSISSECIMHFQNLYQPLQYWVALEPDSAFNTTEDE